MARSCGNLRRGNVHAWSSQVRLARARAHPVDGDNAERRGTAVLPCPSALAVPRPTTQPRTCSDATSRRDAARCLLPVPPVARFMLHVVAHWTSESQTIDARMRGAAAILVPNRRRAHRRGWQRARRRAREETKAPHRIAAHRHADIRAQRCTAESKQKNKQTNKPSDRPRLRRRIAAPQDHVAEPGAAIRDELLKTYRPQQNVTVRVPLSRLSIRT
jgi:hypothetical protein